MKILKKDYTSKNPHTRLYTVILMTVLILFTSSCEVQDSSFLGIPPYQFPVIKNVSVSPNTTTVNRGGSMQFSVEVSGEYHSQSVNWTISGGVPATTINASGLLNVDHTETATTLTVVATSTEDSSKSGTAIVTVLQPTVSDVVVSPSLITVARGGTQLFTVTVNGSNTPPQTVNWTVSGGITATIISQEGLLTIANNETNSTLTVRATSIYDTSKSGTATVNVVTPTIYSVEIDPPSTTLAVGVSQLFVATVSGTNYPPQSVYWIVTGGVDTTTIGQDGVLTVSNIETNGTLTVRATSTYDASKSGTATITVLIPVISTVDVDPPTVTVARGDSQQFTAMVIGTNFPPQSVTWTVSGGLPTTIINQEGLLTVTDNETNSTLTVRATSIYDTSKSGTAIVTVPTPTVTSVTVTPNTATVAKCQAQLFVATVIGTYNPSQAMMWSVTGSSISTISNDGLLNIAFNETATTLTVRVTSIADFSKTSEAVVTVTPIEIGPGGGYIFYDKGSYSDGWRFLEAAPASSEFTAPWGLYGIACPGTSTEIGTGHTNTTVIINLLIENLQPDKAAMLCAAMTINGKNDWFLPSKDELNLMYQRLRMGGNIGGFNTTNWNIGSNYWSSSTNVPSGSPIQYNYAWQQDFSSGGQYSHIYDRRDELSVRGVRAF